MLKKLKWKSIKQSVDERRLLCIKKYMDGSRYIQAEIFSQQPTPTTRCSRRLAATRNKHSLQLSLCTSQRNALEEKLAIEKMKALWNALPEDQIRLLLSAFMEMVKG